MDSADVTAVINASGDALGWSALSLVANRKGYAGYELDDALSAVGSLYHVRHRVLRDRPARPRDALRAPVVVELPRVRRRDGQHGGRASP